MYRISLIARVSIVAVICSVFGYTSNAQTTDALGTYTPYSLFGLGELEKPGTAINRGMGGIGVGVRDNRVINYLNPASITERDTLSFMLDFGISQKNFYNTNGNADGAYNTANMQNLVFTAPIYRKSALIVGITPFSNIGYKFRDKETDTKLLAKYGDITYEKYGTGSISQLFVGGAVNLTPNLSVGAEMIYYFGALNRSSNVLFDSDASIRDIATGWDYDMNSMGARVGVQYFNNVSANTTLTVGATYRFATELDGNYSRFASLQVDGMPVDTVLMETYDNYRMEIPSEFAAGFSLRKKDKWMIGFDYTRQDWKGTDFGETPGVDFTPGTASSFRLGIEFIPNRYDIRYYLKRATYRLGAYYDKSYIRIGGNQVNATGVTFGMSLPVFRWYNALSWSVDVGQRGSLKNGMVRERYVQFNINMNLHDMWFIKRKYN